MRPHSTVVTQYTAVVACSGLSTGIYATNSAETCRSIAASAECAVIVVENDNQLQKIMKVWDELPVLRAVVQYKGTPQSHPGRSVYSVRIIQCLHAELAGH